MTPSQMPTLLRLKGTRTFEELADKVSTELDPVQAFKVHPLIVRSHLSLTPGRRSPGSRNSWKLDNDLRI